VLSGASVLSGAAGSPGVKYGDGGRTGCPGRFRGLTAGCRSEWRLSRPAGRAAGAAQPPAAPGWTRWTSSTRLLGRWAPSLPAHRTRAPELT